MYIVNNLNRGGAEKNLYQIISNFILNSLIHAYDESGHLGVIRIRAREENGLVTLEYMDDGKGVEEEIKKHMFEPFFTTKRGQGGSGHRGAKLGLRR